MSGMFSGGQGPAPIAAPVDVAAEAKVAQQEAKVEAQETKEKRSIQARKSARRTGSRSMLMAPGVTGGDDGPGRQVLSRTLGISRNAR